MEIANDRLDNIFNRISETDIIKHKIVNNKSIDELKILLLESRPKDEEEILIYNYFQYFIKNGNNKAFLKLLQGKTQSYILWCDNIVILLSLGIINLVTLNIGLSSVNIESRIRDKNLSKFVKQLGEDQHEKIRRKKQLNAEYFERNKNNDIKSLKEKQSKDQIEFDNDVDLESYLQNKIEQNKKIFEKIKEMNELDKEKMLEEQKKNQISFDEVDN
jgi:hypothetical protein